MQRDVVAREAGTHAKWALCAPNRSCKRTPAPTGAPWAGNTLLNGQVAVTEVCREATHVRPRTDTLRTLRQRPPSQPYSPSATSGQPRWPTGAALASRSLCLSVLFSPRYPYSSHGGRCSRPGWWRRQDLAPWAHWASWGLCPWEQGESTASEALHEAAWKEPRAACPLQGPLVPAVLALLVHKDDVSLLQLNLCLALGRVRHHHAVPEGTRTDSGPPGHRLWPPPQGPGQAYLEDLPLLLFAFSQAGINYCNLGLLFPLSKLSTYLSF